MEKLDCFVELLTGLMSEHDAIEVYVHDENYELVSVTTLIHKPVVLNNNDKVYIENGTGLYGEEDNVSIFVDKIENMEYSFDGEEVLSITSSWKEMKLVYELRFIINEEN